ncbi:MAG: hypothetical protein ACT4PP_04470 [Sporichthyaceae bacterium]
MNDRLRDLGYTALAGALVIAGLICVLLGYLGVRNEEDIALQLPYLASGGVLGLALIALGAIVMVKEQMREQARRSAAVTETLEEWKEAAMAELRAFLEGATLDLEITEAAPNHRREPVGSGLQ